jgi:hypothetical protein
MCILALTKVLLVVVLATHVSWSQINSPREPKPSLRPAPGNIQLPEDFRYEARSGIDSNVGTIVRKDGFSINHDIGSMAGNCAAEYFPEHFDRLRKQTHLNSDAIQRNIDYLQNKIVWRQQQTVNGNDVMVVFLKDSTLIASFGKANANFIAKIESLDQIADFFLIVLTYQPNSQK